MSADGVNYECIELNEPSAFYLGKPFWQFNLFGQNFELLFRPIGPSWVIDNIAVIGQPPNNGALWFNSKDEKDCPTNIIFDYVAGFLTNAYTTECIPQCIIIQNRTKKEYNSVKLPEIFIEENRGYFRCCCEANVLASTTSSDSWKNDITSAWIKLSDLTDTATFELYKDGQLATYQPTPVTFPKEPLARYVTIPWSSVLGIDGAGCYRLDITFSIAGVSQTFTWGKYKLKPYSIENALETARVRAIFNAYNEIEQIDFTDSKVVDTLRFYGFIGNAQPNMEIDNIIYDNREMKKVIRENLNTYEIITDPICEDFTKALKDLYLLSENELFISDYNAHNHSYRYQDLPVIVTESPEIEYYDFSREAKLTCIVGDKFKNKRSYYK